MIACHQPQLVIIDLLMPGMDGMELCRRIKEDIAFCHIPVILLTATADHETQLLCYRNGADDYITKPFHQDLLLVRIQNLIRSRESLREKFTHNSAEVHSKTAQTVSPDQKFISRVMELIEQNMDNASFGAADMTSRLGMCRTLIHLKLKEHTGYATAELIRITRLKRARQLLRDKQYRVSEVCYMVGFTDPHYFSKSFKSLFGRSPSRELGIRH
jgi:YesN/AraC family two-component response regulator